jgi:hypothetical protein
MSFYYEKILLLHLEMLKFLENNVVLDLIKQIELNLGTVFEKQIAKKYWGTFIYCEEEISFFMQELMWGCIIQSCAYKFGTTFLGFKCDLEQLIN